MAIDRRSPFSGIRPVLHVPFADEPGQPIIEAELAALVTRMADADVDGLVVLGLASEAWSLDEAERARVTDLVAAGCRGRLGFVVGVDGPAHLAADRARRATEAGADGIMLLPPRGVAGREALISHFGSVAEAGGVPVLVQDSPGASGVRMEVDTIVAMVRTHPLVTAVKVEVPGETAKTAALRASGVDVIAGWGGLDLIEQIDRGAIGCMPGCDLGPAIVAIDRALRSGDRAEAIRCYRQILPLLSFVTPSLELLLLGAKRYLRRAGVFSTESLRAPGRSLTDAEAERLDRLIDDLAGQGTPGFGALGA